jgi:hypothetical protein
MKTLPPEIQQIQDRLDIQDVINRLGICLDEKRIDDLGEIFCDDVKGALASGDPFSSLAGIQEYARKQLLPWARLQHVITNILIDLAGDAASVRANLITMNVADPSIPDRHFSFNGFYKFALRRDGARWKISDIRLLEVWAGGELP